MRINIYCVKEIDGLRMSLNKLSWATTRPEDLVGYLCKLVYPTVMLGGYYKVFTNYDSETHALSGYGAARSEESAIADTSEYASGTKYVMDETSGLWRNYDLGERKIDHKYEIRIIPIRKVL